MKTPLLLGTALLALLGLGAQAQQPASPYEGVVKDILAATDRLTGILAKIINADAATEARPELKKAAADFVAVRKKAEALKQPDQVERDRVSNAYRKKLESAVNRFLQERSRVAAIPGGREVLQELAVLDRPKDKPARPKEKK